ncbi:dihydroxyacetone kinase subunit DhaK [Kineococcus aurantiacus]|uniref:Dihydroxyacetone kinase-like protein n=1 Tax=Kineococcus aurantiacus TaxID=37633 RepID=A0A7Y9AVC8_9ACTN|nr:dihydroxyacetone kinase subunit DhaK [Kineococcus aurantiacus]NYD21225.1 dihydroxyacetone kinase-like protein [Kineococcus aurantiacus]
MTAAAKLLDDPANAVTDALRGLAAVHPELSVDLEHHVVARGDERRPGKVGLVSGGGSGHEPLHAGFVGLGMLDAAACGAVFTSPVPDQVLAATRAASSGAGVVHVVKNYTGDVLNFQMAAELADDEGIEVETVLVDDDVAVTDSLYTAGRRGTGGTLFVEKVLGAAAEKGLPLAEVAALGRDVVSRSRSFGVALSPCTTPGSDQPGFDLPPGEMELGIGIHGEPGRRRVPVPATGVAREVARTSVAAIDEDLPLAHQDLLLLVNGMGGTPLLELQVLAADVVDELSARGARVARALVGNHVTSLEMAGAMVSVCTTTPELLELWDAPVRTPALRWGA